jgi:cytochrome P450
MAQNQPLEDFDPLDPDTVECPYDFYRALRQHGGVYRVAVPRAPDGSHRANPEEVRTLLTADPPEHRKYRELVNKAFSAKRVASWEPRIRAISDELIDAFIEDGRCELIYDFTVPLPLIVICEALGLPRAKLRVFKEWSDGIARPGGMTSTEQRAHSLMAADPLTPQS